MKNYWKELLIALAIAGAGASGGAFATTVVSESRINTLEDQFFYIRARLDYIADRVQREAK